MAEWKDAANNIYNDMGGAAVRLIPAGCILITQEEADALRAPPAPTQAEQFKAIERSFERHMDAVAQSRGYDSRDSCRLYAGYTNPFQAEATAFGQWVANTWVLAFQQQQDVVAGTRPMPTAEEALAEIPAMVWP